MENTIINKEMYSKIEELRDFLDIEESKIINNSMIFGLHKYWVPYKEKISKLHSKKSYKKEVTDELYEFKNDLKRIIDADSKITKNLTKIEKEFEKKYSYDSFSSINEYCVELLTFIKNSSIEKVEETEKVIEEHPKIEPELKYKKEKKKRSEHPKPRNYIYFLYKHTLFLFLAAILSFIVVISIWSSFPYVLSLSALESSLIIVLVGFIIFSFIGLFYYRSFPSLDKWQIRRIIREFSKKYPLKIFKNPTERNQALAGYIQSKYSKDGNIETQEATHYIVPEDLNMRERYGKFTKDRVILAMIFIIIITILLGIWIPLFLMHYLERWQWIANNIWVYLVTWLLIPAAIIDFILLLQKKE